MICSFVLFWVMIFIKGAMTQMNPEKISDEYSFKLIENFVPPEVEVEPLVIPYFDLPSERNCSGLFLSDINITDMMHSNLTSIYINTTNKDEQNTNCTSDDSSLVIVNYNTAMIKDNGTMFLDKIDEGMRLVHFDEIDQNETLGEKVLEMI